MICAKSYENIFNFVKIVPRILSALFFQAGCISSFVEKEFDSVTNVIK